MSMVPASSYIKRAGARIAFRPKRDGRESRSRRRKMTGSTMKLAIAVGILATIFGMSARAQTVSVLVLDQAGAKTVLQAATESAQRRNAPSAIAVVDPA